MNLSFYHINKFQLRLAVGVILFAVYFLFSTSAHAQPNIVRAEYYIDDDPGFGLGQQISITPGIAVDLNFEAETSALSSGYHLLVTRAQNSNGVWSFIEKRQFFVTDPGSITPPTVPNITEIEYFINDDLGQGLNNKIDVTDGITVDINSIAVSSALDPGYHTIGTRARTENGNWGWTEYRNFFVTTTGSVTPPTVKKIVAAEYYFDTDPGQGQATSIGAFGPSLSLDLSELAVSTVPALTVGYHTFNIRGQDEDGHWGFLEQRPIYVFSAGSSTSITDINKVEYFFDGNDPGIGNATSLAITPGQQEIEFNTVDIPTLPTLVDGEHTITFRARNGNGWGIAEIDTFEVLDDCTQPIAAFDPQLACAGSAVVFNNTSTDLQGDATYRWYLDGDAIIDETTQHPSFTYPFPGTYVVALAVRQGTICLDSISTTIEIQPQPVAVFSTTGGGVNQPTSFAASASNLPVGTTWEWDFDGDFNVDDNTAGNTSFIYTSEGTFNPILTITDGNGCFVSVTNPVTVSGTGGQLSPFVDFLANSGCAGNIISFIDISQNLPVGSTYSWDFDGDGNEDASNTGTTSYSFPQAGVFNSNLTINTGVGTLSATHPIEIVDLPVLDFSSTIACEGSVMSFTDLSTPGSGSNVYMWDFNNDGIIDSNAATDVTYTFPDAGSHIVSLKVSNGYGCEKEIVKQVNVIATPSVDFDWSQVCAGVPVSFNDRSQNNIPGALYSWDFDGDGNEDSSDDGIVQYTYAASGIYNAQLTIINTGGCESTLSKQIEIYEIPDVAIDINARCYGQESQMIDLSQKVSPTAKYYWDFGETGSTIDETVGSTNHEYSSYNSYIVTLTIDNGGNCQSSVESLVEFADAAKPEFETNKLCEGEEVVFTNLSTDVNPWAIYSWDFDGDGLEDSAFPGSTAHTFLTAGTYNATLTIDNGGNCDAIKTIPLNITPPPAVDLGNDEILCEAGTVILDAGSGYSSYFWPDGSGNQTYTIDQIGEYTVMVQDAKGCFNTDTIAVKLLGPPVPAFEYNVKLSTDGITLELANTSQNYESISWDLDNGFETSDSIVSITYADFSFFDISVFGICITAINDCEEIQFCEDIFVSPTNLLGSESDEVVVYPNPVQDELTVVLNSQEAKLALINIHGIRVWKTTSFTDVVNIPMAGREQGAYILLIHEDDRFMYKRIIKE